jgi:hypothetical protein
MAKSKFCPECGTEIPPGTNICENCGIVLQTKSTPTKAKKSARPKKTAMPNDFWTTLEPIIVDWVGKYAWLALILIPIIMLGIDLLISIPSIFFGGTAGNLVWTIISTIFEILLAWFWVKPKFSDKCVDRDWDYLLDDVLVLGGYKIPWMLVMGILLEVFGYGWIGLFVLGPAIVIIFFGPRQPYNWK